MEYRNPQLPEGINVSSTHPLLDFARLLLGTLLVMAVLVGAAALLADRLARYVPFSAEERIAAAVPAPAAASGSVPAYLETLVGRLVAAHPLPAGMSIRVHYVDEPTVNAFATLGGNVVVFRGLLEKMPSENALAMVISHEIAHVRLRHPVSSLGRGLAIGVAVATLSSGAGSDIAGRALGSAGLLTALTFSRAQERAADAEALRALAGVYGHVADADAVFRVLERQAGEAPLDPPEFLRTHPLDRERIEAIGQLADAAGWPREGEIQALPQEILELRKTPNPSE